MKYRKKPIVTSLQEMKMLKWLRRWLNGYKLCQRCGLRPFKVESYTLWDGDKKLCMECACSMEENEEIYQRWLVDKMDRNLNPYEID